MYIYITKHDLNVNLTCDLEAAEVTNCLKAHLMQSPSPEWPPKDHQLSQPVSPWILQSWHLTNHFKVKEGD